MLHAQLRGKRLAQGRLALAVQAPHAAQVARELTAVHEVRHGQLLQAVAAAQHLLHGGCRAGGQGLRQHHKAQAQCREHGLAEGAHIEHGRVRHLALHGGDGRALVAEFAVVVVFDDPRARAALQQVQPARHRQHGARGILVRGRDLDQPWRMAVPQAGAMAAPSASTRSVLTHRSPRKGRLGAPVAGLLQPGMVARVGEQLHAQVQRTLGAFGDDDARGIAAHAARDAQVLRNGLAQRRLARRIAIVQRGAGGKAQCAVLRTAPGGQGNLSRAGVPGVRGRLRSMAWRVGAMRSRRRAVWGAQGRGGGLGGCRGMGGHSRHARALPVGDHIAFGRQLLVGDEHGVARDSQILRQRARGRQAVTGR